MKLGLTVGERVRSDSLNQALPSQITNEELPTNWCFGNPFGWVRANVPISGIENVENPAPSRGLA